MEMYTAVRGQRSLDLERLYSNVRYRPQTCVVKRQSTLFLRLAAPEGMCKALNLTL